MRRYNMWVDVRRVRADFCERLGNKLLDLAERLPRRKSGPLVSLQILREYQRRSEADDHKRTLLPEGIDLTLRYFRIYDVYEIERFTTLWKLIFQLFPNIDRFGGSSLPDEFTADMERIRAGGWWRLGTIMREQDRRQLVGTTTCTLTELPEEVSYIDVFLHRILASVYIISFDVHLTEEAAGTLATLQRQRYLPRVKFWRLSRRGLQRYSQRSAERIKQEALVAWQMELRRKVEMCLAPYVQGEFGSTKLAREPRLPAIEIFSLKGVPGDHEGFSRWAQSSNGWLNSLVLNFFALESFKNNEILFVFQEHSPRFPSSRADKLIILPDTALSDRDREIFHGDEVASINGEGSRFLYAVFEILAIYHITMKYQDVLGAIRRETFIRLSGPLRARARIGSATRLAGTIHGTAMAFDRLKMEYEQRRRSFELYLTYPDDLVSRENSRGVMARAAGAA